MFTRLIVALCMTASAGLASASDAQIVQWPELIPTEGSGEVIDVPVGTEIIGMPTREEFAGTDEDWDYLLESYELQRYAQPQGAAIRADLDGQKVKIPGYVTPLGFGEEDVTEFLLVPYLGACIHVPPPPGNQIVYISNAAGLDQNRLFEPIWVTGTLKATSVGTALADVGYTIDGAVIEPYQ
jgi:hypothetical protein